jgi:transposase
LFGEDYADAEWLAHLLECGLLAGSFIPPADIKAAARMTA